MMFPFLEGEPLPVALLDCFTCGASYRFERKRGHLLVPLWAFYFVGLVYYVLGAVVIYRVLVHVEDPGGKAASFALAVGLLLLNELWNYGFFGLRSTLAGFLGIAVFLVVLTALMAALRRYERFSAGLLVPYYLWVVYDLAWTCELWRLNGAA